MNLRYLAINVYNNGLDFDYPNSSARYDSRNQLVSTVEDHAGSDIGEWFEYDLNGNIVHLERSFDGVSVQDYLGSTRAVIDEDGNILQSTAYYPSGVPLTPNELSPQTIKLHTGKDFFDLQGAGWYDNQARYYDCLIPTFKSQDPLAEKYPWLSPYNHCANNPLRFVDRDGMRWLDQDEINDLATNITNKINSIENDIIKKQKN